MCAWIRITDEDWFRYLKSRSDLDEMNFWQPGGPFDAQDRIDLQRDDLIKQIEGNLQQKHSNQAIFRVRWRLS